MEAGGLPSAKQSASAGHRFREFIKFSIAISAVGSAAFGAYQALQQPEPARRSPEVRREAPAGTQRTFFQALIEADRDALKGHSLGGSSPPLARWKGFERFGKGGEAGKPGQPAGGSGEGGSLRDHFASENAPADSKAASGGWDLAFVSSGVAKRQQSQSAPAQPATPRPASSPSANPPPRPAQQDQNANLQRADAAPARPAAAGNQGGAQRPAQKPAPAPVLASPKPGNSGFKEVHAGQMKPVAPVPRDDYEFAASVVAAAERDIDYLPRAQAVVAEFSRRHPHATETNQLRTRQAAIRTRHAAAVTERSTLTSETRIAPVLFEPEARERLAACLSRVGELQRISAVNRPVSSNEDRLAFLVAATVAPAGTQPREQYLEGVRQRIAPALGACLAPLFAKGTVALALTDGLDSDITRRRIDGEEGATIFQRDSAAAAH